MRWPLALVGLVAGTGCHLVFELEEAPPPETRFTRVSAGGVHTCAIDPDGLWCWGDNLFNQIGDGLTTPEILTPERIQEGDWAEVSAGYTHSCALDSTGQLWCWGSSSRGQLGLGAAVDSKATPFALAGSWKSVSLGSQHTCAIDAADTLHCWGQGKAAHGMSNGDYFDPTPVTVAPRWTQVATGAEHTCAIDGDGGLWCWGENRSGQLGLGAPSDDEPPTRVGLGQWRDIAAGVSHTCAIDSADALYCWGSTNYGELGAPVQEPAAPTRIGSERWSAVETGGNFTCGRRVDDSVWCWGSNLEGQLGTGEAMRDVPPIRHPRAPTAFSLGIVHACAIIGTRIECTGNNAYGQLGDGSGGSRLEPAVVDVTGVETIALATRASCATTSSNISCWGSNFFGELGRGDRDETQMPASFTRIFAAASAGGQSICAIEDTPTRRLYCWGDNRYGQLAIGGNPSVEPTVDTPRMTLLSQVGLVAMSRASESSEPAHGCATDAVNLSVKCWGANTFGQLGIPRDQLLHPVPAPMMTAIAMTKISAGAGHTCGIDNNSPNKRMWCWGNNRSGQLGAPAATIETHVPQQVGLAGAWSTVVAGDAHTCALDTAGGLWCWGQNASGQLGDGTRITRFAPVRVMSPTTWLEVSVGSNYTCGIQTDLSLWCWGRNGRGQLGVGSTETHDTPVRVGDAMWSSIAAGDRATCGRQDNGALACWGDNLTGQVGDGSAWRIGYEPIAVQ